MMRSSRVGGGNMLRAASRVVSGKEAFSFGAGSSTARGGGTELRTVNVPSPLPPAASTSPTLAGEEAAWNEWETINPEAGEVGSHEFWLLETMPSSEEVEAAIWSLQQMSIPSTFPQQRDDGDDAYEDSNSDTAEREIMSVSRTSATTEPESDWIEPALNACSEISTTPNNCQKALEAFHLLKVNPSIKRMVVSLSSDRAVWDAVMKNEAVQEIKKSLSEGVADAKSRDSTGPLEAIVSVLGSLYSNTKTTVTELIEKVTTFVNNLVHSSEKKDNEESEFFSDAVKSSLMLSVFVFLIVILGRLQK
ncbi:uncharacterized protein LOC144571378 isoform X2 [Carex rostrata]